MNRRWALLIAALLTAALALAACSSSGSKKADLNDNAGAGTYQGFGLTPPQPRPSFTLTDTTGAPYSFATATAGVPTFLYFGYTHCPDVCPTALNDLSLALDQLGSQEKQVGIVFISVDPARDTPDVLKSYVESFGGPIEALTGTPDAVAQAAKDYKVFYAKHPRADGGYDMDHSALIYVMDPQGRFTATFTPDDTSDTIAARLKKLVS
jgi:protein SCO1